MQTATQRCAPYGRVKWVATVSILDQILRIQPKTDVFIDIGHGAGNAVLQAAYTVGCLSRGIEVVEARHKVAERFEMELRRINTPSCFPSTGSVEWKVGRLEDPQFFSFIVDPTRVTKAFANNWGGVFGHRITPTKVPYSLDDYLAGLFIQFPVGSVLATMHPLTLGMPRNKANAMRKQHNLPPSPLSSFFIVQKISLGMARDVCTWFAGCNAAEVIVYKYTRVNQTTRAGQASDGGRGDAVFLCCNPSCQLAVDSEPIPASKVVEVDGETRHVLNRCVCGFEPTTLRSHGTKSRA
jgi:Histone methylation protein DOT1